MLALCLTAWRDADDDILPLSMAWHRAQGVDHILIARDQPISEQGQAMTELQDMALWLGCEWVLNSDADEFWVPSQGTLAELFVSLPPGLGMATAAVVEFTIDGAHSYSRHMNWMGQRLAPKTCHRPAQGVRVLNGNAGVSGAHGGSRLLHNLQVLHWPLRSAAQAQRKCQSLAATFPVGRLRRNSWLAAYQGMALDPVNVLARLPGREMVPDARLQRVLETSRVAA